MRSSLSTLAVSSSVWLSLCSSLILGLAHQRDSYGQVSRPETVAQKCSKTFGVDPASLFGELRLNPSGHAPLTAEIAFRPNMDGSLRVEVNCVELNESTLLARFSFAGTEQFQIPILGLFPGCENELVFTLFDVEDKRLGSHTTKIQTADLPRDFPKVSASGTYDGDAMTFITYFRARTQTIKKRQVDGSPIRAMQSMPSITGIMLDKLGRVRWYSDFRYRFLFPMEFVGDFIYGSDWLQDTGLLQWYDLMGRRVGSFDLNKNGFQRAHHDIIPAPSGTLIVTVDRLDGDYVEDHVIEIDPTNGNLVRSWNLAASFPDVADLYRDVPKTGPEHPGFSNDPVHANGIAHDHADGGLIVCSQRSGVIKLRRDGRIAWFLAPHLTRWIDDQDHDGFSDSFSNSFDFGNKSTWLGDLRGPNYTHERMPIEGKPDQYPFEFSFGELLLTPLDGRGEVIADTDVVLGYSHYDGFRWPFRPHAPRLLSDGRLLLLDNGLERGFKAVDENSFSRAVAFEIVEDQDGFGGTVRQSTEVTFPSTPKWHRFSPVVSEVDELNDGSWLVCLGALGSTHLSESGIENYGNGPRGAQIVQIDPSTGQELHTLQIDRVISDEYPNAPFSVYRAQRITPYQSIPLPVELKLLP